MTETLWKSLWSNVSLGTLGCSRIVGEESVQFSHSIMSDSLQLHGLQHARLLCPSLSSGVGSNSCPFELVMLSNHFILCCPLLLLPSIIPNIRVFSKESALRIRWPKYWSFSFWPLHSCGPPRGIYASARGQVG